MKGVYIFSLKKNLNLKLLRIVCIAAGSYVALVGKHSTSHLSILLLASIWDGSHVLQGALL